MSKVVLPDNIHFYSKNPNNVVSIVPTFSSQEDVLFSLDYSGSIGQSEVSLNLLGLPRSEPRGVIYEDVPLYGADRNRWVAGVDGSRGLLEIEPSPYDPNIFNFANPKFTGTRLKGKIDLMAGKDECWLPGAPDYMCPEDPTRRQGVVYNLPLSTFRPIVYQNADDNSIVLEAFPADFEYNVDFGRFKCRTPAYVADNSKASNYKCFLESREAYRYEPGKVIGFTFGIATTIKNVAGFNYVTNRVQNKTAKWGVRNNTDAYYFLLDGTELKLVRESIYGENSVVLTKDKFIDPLDGTGKSKAKIDFSKVTMYSIEFSWYGAIGATFFVYLPVGVNETKWIRVGELVSSNKFTVPALSDPYMKMFMELEVPNKVKSPHFLKKYGSSVYMDGDGVKKAYFTKNASITTGEKFLTPDTRRTLAVFEVPEKDKVNIGRFNRNKFFPLTLEAYFNEDVELSISTSIDNFRQDNSGAFLNANHSYPSLTLGISNNENLNNIFYNNSGPFIPFFNDYGSPINYSDSLFDFVLTLNRPINYFDKFIDVNVPNNYDVNAVIRHFLNNYPLVYDPILINRITQDNAYALTDNFNDFGISSSFNGVLGLDCLPKISNIQKNGRNLKMYFDVDYSPRTISSSDGYILSSFNPSHLNPDLLNNIGGASQYPNYGPSFSGKTPYNGKPFGGVKMAATSNAYNQNCKIVGKRNYHSNNSFYIVNNKINTGKVYFQQPVGPTSHGFILEDTLNTLKSVNFFRNVVFPDNTGNSSASATKFNIQKFLNDNSVIYSEKNIQFIENSVQPPIINNRDFFNRSQPYSSTYYDIFGNLKGEYYLRWMSTSSRLVKQYYKPIIRYNDNTSLLQLPEDPKNALTSGNADETIGYEIDNFYGNIQLTPQNYLGSFGDYHRYSVSFSDVAYLRDGVPTSSINFYTMLLNNSFFFNDRYCVGFFIESTNAPEGFNPNTGSTPVSSLTGADAFYAADNIVFTTVEGYYDRGSGRFEKYYRRMGPITIAQFYAESVINKNVSTYNQKFTLFVNTQYLPNPVNRKLYFNFRTVTPICINDVKNKVGTDNSLYYTSIIKGKYIDPRRDILEKDGLPELQLKKNDMYFYFTIGVDLSGNSGIPFTGTDGVKTLYNDGSQRLKTRSTLNNLNNKFSFLKFESLDFLGNRSNSMSPIASDNIRAIKRFPLINTTIDTLDPVSLSGTSYSNEEQKAKKMNVKIYSEANYPSNFSRNIGKDKFNFSVPKNKKITIDLRYLYNTDRSQILPSYNSNFRNFNTFLIISGISRNNVAKGALTINFEERV
jgi:hypothetical protein